VRGLDQLEDGDLDLVGGKAHSLGVLVRAGFPVPPGFALTTRALEHFLSQPELAAERPRLDGEVGAEELARFRDRIVEAPLPREVGDALYVAYERFFAGERAAAVRSSGTREDLDGASFAGQYETILGVRGHRELERAVKQCWASLWQPRVLDYARRRGGGTNGLAMSVVVQELVTADVAGVLFTVNPLTGVEREVLVEAVFGLGEALVSGKVNADRYVLDIETGEVLSREIADKAIAVRAAAAGTEETELGAEERTRATLDDEELLGRLARVASEIQEHYGRPMDVEWVLAGGEIAVVQARPITHISFSPEIGEWTTADFRDGGVASDVCAPFMWSLYRYAIERSMPDYFKEIRLIPRDHEATWANLFFARPYWNLGEVKRALEKTPGYSEDAFHADLGVEVDPEAPGKTTPVTTLGLLKALPILFALRKSYRERLAANRALAGSFDERKREFDLEEGELRALSDDDLAARYRKLLTELYLQTETSYFYTIYNTSNSKLDFKPVFERVKKAAGGGIDPLRLVSGLSDLSHLRPMKDMHSRLAELHREGRAVSDELVADFARAWRHHGRKELDIRVPRWHEDPGFVREMLERALESFDPERDPAAHEAQQRREFEAERDRALAALGWRPLLRRNFRKKLELCRTYAWWREEMRDHSSFAYYLVRLWALEVARRLADRGVLEETDDVWYLTWQDSLAAVEGELAAAEARERVGAGRRLIRWFRNFENPNEIGVRYRYDEEDADADPGDGALRGTGGAAGRVTGRARVVRTLEQAMALDKGDILVTAFTDPGWTPLFARISAVVTETGGVLSHAAVIAREYGIPAVLAVPHATRAIADGETITVDGSRGIVEREPS
jgi:phosphohistidine swiveling domain-containing protein